MAQRIKGRVLTRRKARLAQEAGQLQLVRVFQKINFLESPGKLLVCDIENTIAPRGHSVLSVDILDTFARAYSAGYHYIILRTNKKRKLVKKSVKEGTSPYYSGRYTGDFDEMIHQLKAVGFEVVLLQQPQKVFWPPWAFGKWPRKPWRITFRSDLSALTREIKGKTVKRSEIMVVGDKFRFDCLRPILMGWNAVLVNPIGGDGKGDKFALIRPAERFTLWRLGLKRPS